MGRLATGADDAAGGMTLEQEASIAAKAIAAPLLNPAARRDRPSRLFCTSNDPLPHIPHLSKTLSLPTRYYAIFAMNDST